ncbi:MAG: hypothetical protein ACOYEV_03475 [Candidatus Nanopelagicales bacterium]
MRKILGIVTAVIVGWAGVGGVSAPATAAPGASSSVVTAVATKQITYPSAVPGRFCKNSQLGDWTSTRKYGRVVCKYDKGSTRYHRWYRM